METSNPGKLKEGLSLDSFDFLFLSNGYGEDAIAAKIAEVLKDERRSAAFPLIGRGISYENKGIPVLMSFSELPSAGVSLFQDFKSGLVRRVAAEWRTTKKWGRKARFMIAVGDIFPVFLAQFSVNLPIVFIGTAKSHYVQEYNFLERVLLKKNVKNFVRDKVTAEILNKKKVHADFVGNPMMDESLENRCRIPNFDGLVITLLPGSRSEFAENFLIQVESLQFLQKLTGGRIQGIAHLPPALNPQIFVSKLNGWDGVTINRTPFILGAYKQGEVSLLVMQNSLGDALHASTLVLGQAGTGNEQAAGTGKPVVAFDLEFSRNGKLSWYRWRQKKLLGDALAIVKADSKLLAAKVFFILQNRDVYQKMSEEGKMRMGPSGGSQKIAGFLRTL
jgi:uncharacterized protein (TIGR03492 family)